MNFKWIFKRLKSKSTFLFSIFVLWKSLIFLFRFSFKNLWTIFTAYCYVEPLTACGAVSYGKPYMCYFQCFWSLEGSCDKQNLTFVGIWYEIYETSCVISVVCSPKARKIWNYTTRFINFILNDHSCKILCILTLIFIRFTASAFRKLRSIYVFSYFPFGFEGRMWDLLVSIPDHCLSFYFCSSYRYSPKFWDRQVWANSVGPV